MKRKCEQCEEPITVAFIRRGKASLCITCAGKPMKQGVECKTCDQCKVLITAAYVRQGTSDLCTTCAEKLMKYCVQCKGVIQGPYIERNNGDCYHAGCIHCMKCKKQADIKNINDTASGFVCVDCIRAELPKCAGCGQVVDSLGMQVGSKVYHPGCFKCHKCGKMSSSTTHDGTGFLCESCEPRCSACRKPLRGKFVKTDDMACHPECFRCAMCKEQLAEHFKSPQGFVCAKCSVMERQGVADAIDRRKNELNIRVRKEQALQYKLNWSKSEREESTCVLSQLGVANLGNDVGITLGADVRVAKVQHTAHVNMAYLATALSIFDVSDADPKFSLDPANQQKMSESEFQVKKFYPEFLENTPYGEVLFQADFVLKKLAFGEIAIPGLDLLSADSNSIDEMPFMGREWFVVREATVDVTQDGFLIPRVKMGVECREIVDSPDGIKDAPYTDANSRFVKHAKKVTEHFYEIAQHIPVIAELLEVAKATVLARYLVRKGAKVDKDVIRRISHPRVMRTYEKQIPTVIKHQHFSTVHNDEKGVVRTDRRIRTLHGGVDLTIPNKIGEVTTSSRKRVSLQSGRTESLPLFRASCGA